MLLVVAAALLTLAIAGVMMLYAAQRAEAVPSVTFKCSPAPVDCSGWYRSNVSIDWTVIPDDARDVGCIDASIEAIRGFNELMPLTASAGTAAKIFKTNGSLDVQAQARGIRCPTLVLHGRGEIRIPFEEGRLIAGLIPGARFISLETRNHLMMQDEPAWHDFLDALEEFYPSRAAPSAGAFASLTAREREILDLIAEGLDNAQIAARLALSEKTVRNNITHIFDKIQVENRSQAIVLARQAGLGASRRAR
jgi:DNA-binding CsgD family transcriptional regulator